MSEAAAGAVVVFDFDDQLRAERFPFAGAFGAPAARAARRLAGEAAALARRLAELFDLRRELLALAGGEGRAEPDVVEEAVFVVEAEQQRAEGRRRLGTVAEAADDALDGADVLDLLHAGAVAGAVIGVEPLGDD